jgi:hypothetical protein
MAEKGAILATVAELPRHKDLQPCIVTIICKGQHEVPKRCRLSWLTDSAQMRGGGGCDGASANEYSCAHGAKQNLGDLTTYLTYEEQGHDKNSQVF